MQGKICIITGANSGIGKATALGLARKGAKIVMLCRNKERGEQAREEIINESDNQNIDLLIVDLASQNEIRHCAKVILAKYDKIHVLINNAGLMLTKQTLTEDGIEKTFAVNYLAPFLLTNLLLERLKESAPSRIINVTSIYHKYGKIHFNDINREKHYNTLSAYGQSKLALILFTHELDKILKGTGVTVNAIHPGVYATDIIRDWSWIARHFGKRFLKNPKKAVDPLVYIASSRKLENITGKYFNKKKQKKSSKMSYKQEVAKKLWKLSEEMTNCSYSRSLKEFE